MDNKFLGKIAICVVILGLGIFAFNILNTSPGITQLLLPPVQASATAQKMLKSVTLVRSEVAVQENGHLARAAFAINNNSGHDIKNVEILCTILDAKGTEQGRDTWVVYDTIKAHANGVFSNTARMYVSDRASASQCQIVDMDLVTAPLVAVHRAHAESHDSHHETPGAQHGGQH